MASDIVEELLNRVDIVEVIQRYVPLKRAGSNFSGCCPFHREKTPSFMVSSSKQIFKCFGCGIWGNVFKFIQEIEKCDFRDAVKMLAEREHLNLSQYQRSNYSNAHSEEKEKLKRIHKLAQEYFTQQLQKHPEAQKYLKEKRNLTDDIVKEFGLGYAPDHFSDLLSFLRSQGFTNSDLLEASLAKQKEGGEPFAFFRNRITFPICDLMKNVVGFTARAMNSEDQPKYLNSSEHKAFEKGKILYGLSHSKPHIIQEKKVIIVEGQMDVIGLRRLGFPIGVATSGTALTDFHIKTLKRFTENVYLLFDNDSAGLQATFRALKLCYHQNIYPKMLSLPEGYKDADELANNPEGKEIFAQMIEKAEDGFIQFFGKLRNQFDMNSPIDKQKFINSMFELIIAIDNLTIQEHYKGVLAEKLGFSPEIIGIQFDKYKRGEGKILLRQYQNEEEEQKAQKYKIDRETLFDALFFEKFIDNLLPNDPFLSDFYTFWNQIVTALPDSLLGAVLQNTLEEDQKNEVRELQLRRENELEKYPDQETKKIVIKKIISQNVQEYFKFAIKSPVFPDEEKIKLTRLKMLLLR